MFNLTNSRKARRGLIRTPFLFSATLFLLTCSTIGSPAEAMQAITPDSPSAAGTTMSMNDQVLPPPIQADPCLPLLNIRYDHYSDDLDRNRRAAGSTAENFGIVVGIRFSLSSDTLSKRQGRRNKPKVGIWMKDGNTTGRWAASLAYSSCQENRAFDALSDWRWHR